MKLTAMIEKTEEGWYVGQIQEIPVAIAQAKTIEELKANLVDALELLFKANREGIEKAYQGKDVIREEIILD